jgi:hypothetical protein
VYISEAPLPSVQRGRRGITVFVDDDALGVAKQLSEMEFPSGYGKLRLAWNEFREEFVVIQVKEDDSEHFVTSAEQADGRLIDRVRRITHPSYDFAKELDEIDARADQARASKFSEQVAEYAEKLAFAIRQDTSTPRTDINRIPIRIYRDGSKSTS